MRGRLDEDQLQFASDHDRILFTANTRDFRRIASAWLAAGKLHPGIIALSKQATPIAFMSALSKCWVANSRPMTWSTGSSSC